MYIIDKSIIDLSLSDMKKQAFTLVELIVVVTILAILATIGFVSYSGYLTGVRDTNRVASLTAISDGLELYRTKNDLPLPDSSVEVQVESEIIARQGYAGSNVLQTIEYSKAGKDPKDDQYYSYYLTDDKKHYQMMAFLEESDNLETSIFTQTNAATDYSNRHPKVYGKRLGILTDADNTPIQEITTIKTAGNLNMTGGTVEEYIAILNDSQTIQGTGSTLTSIGLNATCKRIKEINGASKDGVYTINPKGNNSFEAYCDMTTQGGGWTLIFKAKNGDNGSFQSANGANDCISWENDETNYCRKKTGFDFDNIMIAAHKNVPGYEGEYRSIIQNIDYILKDYFKSGIKFGTSAAYVFPYPSSDYIKNVGGFKSFNFIPSRIYWNSGFYFNNNITTGHNSILINTHTYTDSDRVSVPGHSTIDNDSIIGLFVK